MEPLASTRISLRWLPEPPAQDEDVLVISGRTGFFLDLRTVNPGMTGGQSDEQAGEGIRLSWATAGWKELLPRDDCDEHPRARFTAVIDSRHPADSPQAGDSITDAAAPDEGSFEPLPNGDVLEKGTMLRPETGQVCAYEEVWRRLPLAQDVRVLFLEWASADGRQRAYLGRVGNYELGMLDGREGFGVVRREKRTDGRWETLFTCGAGPDLPSLADVAIPVGTIELDLAGRTWRVLETSGSVGEH